MDTLPHGIATMPFIGGQPSPPREYKNEGVVVVVISQPVSGHSSGRKPCSLKLLSQGKVPAVFRRWFFGQFLTGGLGISIPRLHSPSDNWPRNRVG